MKATILIDNLTKGTLAAEWGLSIHIEYEGRRILLDTGASGRFADNAGKLGIGKIYTGHCIGDAAFAVLKEELGEQACQIRTGMEIVL